MVNTWNWCCHQKWSCSLTLWLLVSAWGCPLCHAGMAAGANLSVLAATMQLNLPQCPHPAAPRVLLGQKGAGQVGQPGRELSSSISLQLLQEPLMLHPYPWAIGPTAPPRAAGGPHGPSALPRTWDCSGNGSDFLPGTEELESWAPSPAEGDGNPASITNNTYVGKPLCRAPPLHCRGMPLWLTSAMKVFNYPHSLFFVVLIGPNV